MSKLLAFLLIPLAITLSAHAADTPHVQVKTAAFTVTLPPTNAQVVLEPLRTVTAITNRSGFTDTTGQITFSNAPAGQYRLLIRGVQDLELEVPDASGVIQAVDYVTTPDWDPPVAELSENAFFRGIPYLWPSAQGEASTVLQNDGSGNLSWVSGASVNIWTDTENEYLPTATNTFGFSKQGGGLWFGKNATNYWGPLAAGDALVSVRDFTAGEDDVDNLFSFISIDVSNAVTEVSGTARSLGASLYALSVGPEGTLEGDVTISTDTNGTAQILISSNFVPRVAIAASGDNYFNGAGAQLGIGTNAPLATLHVRGTAKIESETTHFGIVTNHAGTRATNVFNGGWADVTGPQTNRTTAWATNIFNGGWIHNTGNLTNQGSVRATNGLVVPSASGLTLGTGTTLTNILSASAALTWTGVAAQTSQDQVVSVAGTTTNDVAIVTIPMQIGQQINCAFTCFTSNDNVWVRMNNYSSATRSTNGVVQLLVFKR